MVLWSLLERCHRRNELGGLERGRNRAAHEKSRSTNLDLRLLWLAPWVVDRIRLV